MTRQTYTLEIITPCFCAGAHADRAEIRVPAIRGQLRWWFRALGGSADDESRVFGRAAGDIGSGSSLRLTLSNYQPGPPWTPPQVDPNSPQSYTWHYARESGKAPDSGRHVAGPRWQTKGAIPPRSTFQLHITYLRPLPAGLQQAFDRALQAFLCFGTLGLRATRGLGAFHCSEAYSKHQAVIETLHEAGFRISHRRQPEHFPTWEAALRDWSAWLRYKLRKEWKAERFSALGGILPRRQTSAVRFRPLWLPALRQFTWMALEAPHHRVLDPRQQVGARPMITPALLTGPAPTPPPPKTR